MNLPLSPYGVKSHFLTLAISLPVCVLSFLATGFPCPGGERACPLGTLTARVSEASATHLPGLPPSAEPRDNKVVINEIMADPTPVAGLPDAEWIELYNAGALAVSLKGWELRVGSYHRVLPDSLLLPGQYRVVCSQAAAPSLAGYAPVIALSSFPALRNSGNRITLSFPGGLLSDLIDYSDSWYGDSSRKNGGWSLERIDPARDCGQKANWSVSRDPAGGTPGKANSVMAPNLDLTPPEVTAVYTLSPRSAAIFFSEAMDTLLLRETTHYHLPGNWGPLFLTLTAPGNGVTLTWERPLPPNQPCEVELLHMADECGNPLAGNQVEFVWVVVAPGDVVINEILFDPFGGGNDFVELLNLSGKKIPLNRLVLAARDENGQLKKPVSPGPAGTVLLPGEILAFTTDTAGVLPFYPSAQREQIREIPSLPPMYNEEGCLVLLGDSMTFLEEVNYREEMHHPLLASHEGVSLERRNPRLPANAPVNWHSAAETAGFATPGSPNSAGIPGSGADTPVISFLQTAFSPDYDGYHDELIISCTTGTPGWMAGCQVFDPSGRWVTRLAGNLLLGTHASITWNGRDENGSRLPSGPYLVLVELFHPDGRNLIRKCAVFLTARGDL